MGYTHVGECRWAADDDILDWVWKEHGLGVPIASTWVPRRGSLKGKCGKVDYPVGLNPIFSARARDVFADLWDPWGEWLALETSNGGDYYVFHLLTFPDVLDAPSSEIRYYPSGRILTIDRFEFRVAEIDPQMHIFGLAEQWPSFLLVSKQVVERAEANNLTGMKFRRVWSPESGGESLEFIW